MYEHVNIHLYVSKCDFHCVISCIYNPGEVHEAYMT